MPLIQEKTGQYMGAFGVVMVEQIKMEGYSLLLLLVKRRQGRSGIIS